MKIWTQWEYGPAEEERGRYEALFQKTAEGALQEEGIDLPLEAELNVVDDETIRQMNREYRKIDRATDVLSFPLWDLTPGQAGKELSEEEADPETGMFCLGKDVYKRQILARP